jgi:hypothetical protein
VEAPLLVHHARVAGSAATRGDVERWLGRVPIESLGLAEDEVFYVPRLRVRVPERGGIAATHMPARILAALRRLLAGAESGRGQGFVPDRPYRFASRGKYSAWLVRLWIGDGSTAAQEAFRRATGHASLATWQRATLLRDGPALVATIARLAEIGIAARWVARFEPADLAIAHRAVEASFALPLAAAAAGVERDVQPAGSFQARTAPTDTPSFLRETVAWLMEHGNLWHALPAPARTLLLVTAVLARKPAIASGQAMAVATAIATVAAEPALLASETRVDPVSPPAPARTRETSARDAGPAQLRRPRQVQSTHSRQAAGPRQNAETSTIFSEAERVAAPFHAATPQQFAPPTAVAAETPGRVLQPALPAPLPAALLAPDTRFSTDFGGLLFLVNAFVALGLYPDFTEPRGKRLEPSPLWLVDRIGRYWFGARYRRDPLANWVAAHAESGRLPLSWRMEPDWLVGFGTTGTPRLTRGRRHTTLWHPAGFPLFDGDDRDCRLRKRRRARPVSRAPARLPLTDRWSACLALYLNARLERLGGSGLSLLAQPARVETRDLDLQAVFGLDRHPVELRFAGLDRNPGWQPAEGRSIAFAFE